MLIGFLAKGAAVVIPAHSAQSGKVQKLIPLFTLIWREQFESERYVSNTAIF